MPDQMENDTYNEPFYRFYLWVFVVILIGIPVIAVLLGNAWLSLGILFFLLSSWIPWITVPALLVYAVYVWSNQGFSFSQYPTFFLACAACSALLFYFARKKVLPAKGREAMES
ncbi:MAG: hypothetical protein EOO14_01480 [Chitinophagaceae bacterium]|nr:MAG: hypothetical protein EOO14_01480 [Chitinophagaceae bacterium]